MFFRSRGSTEQVGHGVKFGGFTGQKPGGVERSQGEAVTVQGPVREFQALPHQSKDDCVLARVVACAQGVKTDFPIRPLADQAGVHPADLHAIEARFNAPVFPGDELVVHGWDDDTFEVHASSGAAITGAVATFAPPAAPGQPASSR